MKASHWETTSKAVTSEFLASWSIHIGRREGTCVILSSEKLKLLLRGGSIELIDIFENLIRSSSQEGRGITLFYWKF